MQPYMLPTRTPKCDWPKRTAAERRTLHLERSGGGSSNTGRAQAPEVERYIHSQFVQHSVGAVVATRLTAQAKKRNLEDAIVREDVIDAMVVEGLSNSSDADIFCTLCGIRRKLCFIGGVRSRQPCLCLKLILNLISLPKL